MGGRLRNRPVRILVAGPALVMALASWLHGLVPERSAALLDRFLSATCHRFPARCIDLPWGMSGLCARCTAFWSGMALGALIPDRLSGRIGPPAAALLILPLAADGLMQHLGLYESSFLMRTATGLLAGAGVSLAMIAILRPGEGTAGCSRRGG